jgi:glutamyl-tRNA reductase
VARILVGADFHDVPLSFLESAEPRSADLRRALASRSDVVTGSVVVATCHRLEVYAEVKDTYPALDAIVESLAETLDQSPAVTGRTFRVLYESSVTRHLFSVTSGLEAMVVGETEISGQVKRSVDLAQAEGTLTPGLRRLFDRAVTVSKKIHTETGINSSGRSLIDAAIEASGDVLDAPSTLSALIIGTGTYARVVKATLARRGVTDLSVYSPSGRADVFAAQHGLQAVSGEGLVDALNRVDFVVSASGQPGHIITPDTVSQVMAGRKNRPITLIDLALARDIDPRVAAIDGCHLVALEDLKDSADQRQRRTVWEAERLVDEFAKHFADDERARSIDPVVIALRDTISRRVEEEIERVRRRHGDEVARRVEQSLRRVTNQLLHVPTLRGKDLALSGHEDDYAQAVRTLFDVEVPHGG